MNKTAIKNFSVWARNKLISDIRNKAGLLGITEGGIKNALPQSTGDIEFYDIGTSTPYFISGDAVKQRRMLVKAIRDKERDNGYKTAYKYIIEEVAYTWFNRLIAVRFMEVNDYLPSHIRVLSSESGKIEPDLLTTPFDAELYFTADEKQRVQQLKRDNEIDELFRILFIRQCNALNKILPGLFERINDYTELLFNVSVVDQGGVLYRLTHDIDEDDFNIEKGGQVEIIGWLYQYYNAELKAAVFAKPSGTKISKEEIPAATQLFTPRWIVRYMVENSLGRLWVEGHPDDTLKSNWKYYIEEAEQEPEVAAQLAEIRKDYAALRPEDIKCIDPCMGSGHILCYMFDLLMQIYRSRGYADRDAAQEIVRHNLYGLDIDRRATQFAYFSVMMKARQYDRRFFTRNMQPMVYCIAGDDDGENFGALVMVDDPGERPDDPENLFELADYDRCMNVWSYRYVLSQKYHVVCTNPPYMGGAGMNETLSEYIKKNFPDSKSDLSTAFMEKALSLCTQNGYMAMINIPVWMFLSSYEQLRKKLIEGNTFINMVHLGRGIFGSDFGTTTFVIGRAHVKGYRGCYRRLFEKQGDVESVEERERQFLDGRGIFFATQEDFSKIPGAPVAYWASEAIVKAFRHQSIGDIGVARQGLATSDNDRFLRLWHEVKCDRIGFDMPDCATAQLSKKKWFPYNKGGEFRRWYGNNDYVLNWQDDGVELKNFTRSVIRNPQYYFRNGITWSKVTAGQAAFRYKKRGHIFDVAGTSIFVNDHATLLYIFGLCNSVVAKKILDMLAPTLNFEVGQVAKLPVIDPAPDTKARVESLVKNCIELSRADWDAFETSWDFERHPLVRNTSTIAEAYTAWQSECADRFAKLKANEEELNRIFIDLYGLQDELTPEVEDKDVTVRRADLQRDIKSLLSYAVGCMFGRYSLDTPALAYAGGGWDSKKYTSFIPKTDGILPITDEEYFDDDIVSLLCEWLKKVYGEDTLEENLNFIAMALGSRNNNSREVIRRYFMTDFFKDHCKTYSVTGSGKRPIYWLFDSGKQNAFKVLIYLHRYTPDTIGNTRINYLHRMQRIYEGELDRMQDMINHSNNTREVAAAIKRKEKLKKQLKECRDYDEKIGHLALSRVKLDLDDGVKVNYRKLQTASDGKFYEVLADSKNIMAKSND